MLFNHIITIMLTLQGHAESNYISSVTEKLRFTLFLFYIMKLVRAPPPWLKKFLSVTEMVSHTVKCTAGIGCLVLRQSAMKLLKILAKGRKEFTFERISLHRNMVSNFVVHKMKIFRGNVFGDTD